MRWKKVQGQGDMEDRRGQSGGVGGGGLPFPIPMGKAGGGIGGLIVIVVLALLFGGNVVGGGDSSGPLNPGGVDETVPQAPSGSQPGSGGTVKDNAFEFAKFVSKDVQDMWTQVFQQAGKSYTRAPVVTFTSGTVPAAGRPRPRPGRSTARPTTRCISTSSFFQELSRRFGAPGDFAAAYVIAHEIGHHVQSLLGIEEQVRAASSRRIRRSANVYSVQLELQADCFAGVWARSTYDRGLLDPGDIDEGLQAAAAVGDDRLGARSREQWTHGSSELRVKWFRTGFDSGKASACDTSDVQL